MIVAETEVNGERKAAINEGFRLIAGCIFGDNAERAKIDMTAPVQQRKQTIAMTAPVTQLADGEAWQVRFIMPRIWTLETLPLPNDPRLKLTPTAAKRFAAIRFSGFAQAVAITEMTERLRNYVVEHDLETVDESVIAFYNPPWTLPFLRRNEIMLELAC